jgi:hypothetical protein
LAQVAVLRPPNHHKARVVFPNQAPAQFHKPLDGPALFRKAGAWRQRHHAVIARHPMLCQKLSRQRPVLIVQPQFQLIVDYLSTQETKHLEVLIHFVYGGGIGEGIRQQAVKPGVDLLFALENVF